MELATVEFEFNVEALFDSHFHFDWAVVIRLCSSVGHNEFFFLCYAVVVSVDDNVNIVPKFDYDSVVAFKLLFDSVELEIILHIISQGAWWLKITHNLQEG